MIMQNEHNLTKGSNPLLGDKDQMWSTRDEQSAETETSEFMYSLIRLIKPAVVVETGCYLGDTTIAIAKALKENNFGKLYACDIDGSYVKDVNGWLLKENLQDWAQVILITGKELIEQLGNQIEFAFIDSGGEKGVREGEINALIPFLKPLQMFALHDTAPQHVGMNAVAAQVQLPKVYFSCPRGLTLFQKL
jgi:predicted O-methyltransferase YrrM